MKYILQVCALSLLLCGCTPTCCQCEFSGRVGYVYYQGENGVTEGITRFKNGIPGTSTLVEEDVWVEIYPNWMKIILKNRNDYTIIIPREKVLRVIVETEEGNNLNTPQ